MRRQEPSGVRPPASPAGGNELKDLFLEAIELPSSERQTFVSERVSDEPGLRGELERLLEAHDRADAASVAAQRSLLVAEEASAGLELPFRMGNYELLEHLAEGGSGVVYRARQIDLGRTVAIKLLRSGRLATGEEVRRFRLEAEAAARLDHSSIVPVYEVGNHEGRHFISMKLIEGHSLDQCMERYHDDPRSAAKLVSCIARAVHHGHRHGVLHRDVKPSNILLDEEGAPHVADFGTAKLIDDVEGQTVTGWILGTPSCMAPEQASGQGDVTVATDVYSLGCVLYELLVGRPPVLAASLVETLRRVQEDTPTAVRALRPELHPDLETICHTCLAKEPERRYGSALAMAEDLERWLAYEPIEARRATPLERLWLAWRRSPLVTSLVATVLLLAAALVIGTVIAGLELRSSIADTQVAEEFAREQLRNAYLAEARALRNGGQAGRRERALELLGFAAEIRPGRDLLDEGASSLALSDIATRRSWTDAARARSFLCFDGTFERYAVGRLSGEVEVRSALDDRLIARLEGSGYPAWRTRFSADGRYLGLVHHGRSSRQGERTMIWSLEGPELLVDVPRLPAGHFDFAPDRSAVAICWSDGRLHELDLDTREERTLARFDVDNLPIQVRYSSTGGSIAVAREETFPVEIYSLDGELSNELEGHGAPIMSIAWSPDGTRLLAGSVNHRAYVWEVESGELIATLSGHTAEVARTAFPRRDLVATCSWDGTTRLWDLQTGETLASTDELLHESPSAMDSLGLSTPDRVRVGTVVHGQVLRQLHGHGRKDPTTLSIDSTNALIASGGETEVLLWDSNSGERVDELAGESFLGQLFLPDGSLLVASKHNLRRWQVAGGHFVGDPELVHEGLSRHPTLSPDRRLLAFLGEEHLILLPLSGDGEELRITVDDSTDRLAFSADGGLIAAGCYRGSGVRVWSTADGAEVAHIAPEEVDCTPHFSPDGRWLAYGTQREYHVHNVGTWELVYSTSRSEENWATAKVTRFSPDSELLAGAFGRRRIMLLEASSGEALAVFEPPGRSLFSMGRFTPDGRHLVVASESNRVLMWDLVYLRQGLAEAGLDAGLGPGWTRAAKIDGEREE